VSGVSEGDVGDQQVLITSLTKSQHPVAFAGPMVSVRSCQQVQQYHQALLKAKYYPRVAAVSRTHKNTKIHVTLTFDL